MFKDMPNSTRVAFQAATVVLLAVLFSDFFKFERSYWAIMTALILVSQTWGESIKKSFERVIMTILGGIVGTIIYFSVGTHPYLILFFSLFCLFFAIYFMAKSYVLMSFFLTVFVVFIYALLTGWTFQILEERIFETIVGAAIAMVVTAVVFPVRAKTNLGDIFCDYIDEVKVNVMSVFDVALGEQDKTIMQEERQQLLHAYLNLREEEKKIRYELLFSLYPTQCLQAIIIKFGTILHYTTSMMTVASEVNTGRPLPKIKRDLSSTRDELINNLNYIKILFKQKRPRKRFTSLDALFQKFMKKMTTSIRKEGWTPVCWFDECSFFYFSRKLNGVLDDLIKDIYCFHKKKE